MRKILYLLVSILMIVSVINFFSAEDLSSDSRDLSEWRMDGRNLAGTHYYPGKIPQDISQLIIRTYATGDSIGDLTGANGSVYGISLRDSIYRLNASNISQRLDKTADHTLFQYPVQPIWNNFIYAGNEYGTIYQYNISNLSQVIAYNNQPYPQHYSSPIIYQGYIYFTDWWSSTGYLYQANASNVTQLINRYSGSGDCDSAPIADAGYVYYGCGNVVQQFNATNISRRIAFRSLPGSIDTGSGLALFNGSLYVGTTDDKLHQLNSSNVSIYVNNYTTGGDIDVAPAIANGFVYISSLDGYTYQLNASNISQQIANYSTGPVYYGLTVTDDYLLVSGSQIYQLNASNINQKIANYSLGSAGTPTIINGIIYIPVSYSFYQFGTDAPLVTQDFPANASVLSQNLEEINFSCTAFDFVGLVNISLYITTNQNLNFSLNQTALITGQTNSTNWTLNLAKGNYTWNCLVYDIEGNLDWATNRTLAPDTTAPNLNITFPINNFNTSNTTLNINYTVSDSGVGLSSCWYSNDTYSGNITLANCVNITTINWIEGQHNVTIWANDSIGNTANRSVKFTIDTIAPLLNIVTPINNTNSTNNRLNINYTSYDLNRANCWYSNDTYSGNITLANCVNLTTVTWSEGFHNVTIWTNDSAGNRNSSSVKFYIDSLSPNLNITFPINNTYFSNSNININYTVSDSGVGLSSCWYSNDTYSGNITLANCVNITTINWIEGQHNVTIWANDSFGNINNRFVRFSIDNIIPTFNNLTNQTITYGNAFLYQINSTDSAGISCFTVNDTTNFNVNCSGYLRDNTLLNASLYWINITVNDTANNRNSALIYVNVTTRPLIGLNLISPTSNINATQNQTFQVSVNVSCSNTNCGEINVSLDPIFGGTTIELFVGNTSSAWASGSTTYADPINTYYHDVRVQSVYLASDLRAAGIPAGASIRQLYLNISQLPGRTTLANFRIRMNHTNLNITSSAITSWNTTAYGPVSIAQSSLSVGRLLEFNFTNNFTWDGTSNIVIDFSRDDSGWSSNGGLYVVTGLANGRSYGGASDSGYTWPFDSMVSTPYTVVPKIWLTYIGGSSTKTGLVSMNTSATPFYTTTQNPYNLTLNNGESQVITWTVNATGSFNNYTFFVYANKTSDLSISNTTAKWNVTIVNFSIGILPPSIGINYPVNGQNYSYNLSELNYSVSGENLSVCWYSLDSGITNSSYFVYGTNFAGLTSLEGSNTWKVYCNGTNNTIGSATSLFLKDTVFPTWSLNKTNLTSSTLNNALVYFNITLNDTNPGKYIFSWYNGTSWTNNSQENFSNGLEISVNKTIRIDIGSINWTWFFNDSFGNFNQTAVWSIDLIQDNLESLLINCEAGGPYQQNAIVLVQGNVTNSSSVISNNNVTINIFNISSRTANSNLTTSSLGTFQTTFSGLPTGSYTLNASTSKNGYNQTCTDNFQIGSPASFVLDKIATIQNITNTTINYNITLRLTNKGGSDATLAELVDSDSNDSPYNLGDILANSSIVRSYIKEYIRNSSTYNVSLAIASVNATDLYSGNLISENSTSITLNIPAFEVGEQITLTKNAYYNSENSTSVNYTLSIEVINSGGEDLTDISVIDSDLELTANIALNRTQSYNYSSSIIIDKAASNTNKLFVKTSAVVNSVTYYSNQIRVRIPGYGGPADAIVYAPASVTNSESFSTTITVENQNPDIGQDFVIDYWITNEAETINYSSGQQTIYVSASGTSNLTATLTSPSSVGNYRFRTLVSWAGGIGIGYDSFVVSSSVIETPVVSGGSSGGGVTGAIIKDNIVCNSPYIRHGVECCLDKNNNSICDSDEAVEEKREEVKSSDNQEIIKDEGFFDESFKNIKRFFSKPSLSFKAIIASTNKMGIVFIALIIILMLLKFYKRIIMFFKEIFRKVKEFFKEKDKNRLSNVVGLRVYSSEGNEIGRIEEVYLEDKIPKIYGWLIKLNKELSKKYNLDFIIIKHHAVKSIKDVMILDSGVLDYMNKAKGLEQEEDSNVSSEYKMSNLRDSQDSEGYIKFDL